MNFASGEITNQAMPKQILINAAIEKDLIEIASRKACACEPYQMPAVYQASANK